jgi:hypothetical protein
MLRLEDALSQAPGSEQEGRMGDVTVSVHQPNFLPWVKLLDKIIASDVYVVYDTVQFTKS